MDPVAWIDEPKYEDCGDGPVAMSGGSRNHGRVIRNLSDLFGTYLRGKTCEWYPSDMKVAFAGGKYVYPDLSVVCDESAVDDYQINGAPDLVVEVLSPSTVYKDKTVKLPLYFENGAKEVWLVSCEEKSVYVYTAVGEFFIYHLFTPGEAAQLWERQKAALVFDRVASKLFADFAPLLEDVFKGVRPSFK